MPVNMGSLDRIVRAVAGAALVAVAASGGDSTAKSVTLSALF